MKGIDYFKSKGLITQNKIDMELKDVFVTYSWDNEGHKEEVLSFTNYLRRNGFNAEIDKTKSQEETATDFSKMMHQIMTDYRKVIIILSKGYKTKAEEFKGGVGNEFSLIIKDIDRNPKKYVLGTFGEINDLITPLAFKERQILNLKNQSDVYELFAKLKDETIYEFAEVDKGQQPVIEKMEIPEYKLRANNLEIGELIFTHCNSSSFASLYKKIEYKTTLVINNHTSQPFNDYTVEIEVPLHSIDLDGLEGLHKNEQSDIIIRDRNPQIYPSQSRHIHLPVFRIQNFNAERILNDSFKIRIFTTQGRIEQQFPIAELLKGQDKKPVTLDMFQDKNYRY